MAFSRKGSIISACPFFVPPCADWRHGAAEAKGPKLEDFMNVTCSSNKSSSSSLYDSCVHAEQANKYHEVHDLQPLSCGSYYHGGGGIGLGINMNAPPCSGVFPDQHQHQFVPHHGQYFLGAPVASASPPGAAVPMYNAGGGVVGGSMSISGIKSWLREAMYVPPERPAAAALSLAVTDDVPAEPPQLLPAAPTPVHRKPAQTFGQRTSQFRGVTRLVGVSCCAAHQRMHAYMIKISLCWFNVVVPHACWLAC